MTIARRKRRVDGSLARSLTSTHCGCVNEVCMEVTGCGDGCVGMGVGVCFGVWVGGWVSEFWFWTSGIVLMLILTISMSLVCLIQFGQKVDWVSFGKILFNYLIILTFPHSNTYIYHSIWRYSKQSGPLIDSFQFSRCFCRVFNRLQICKRSLESRAVFGDEIIARVQVIEFAG